MAITHQVAGSSPARSTIYGSVAQRIEQDRYARESWQTGNVSSLLSSRTYARLVLNKEYHHDNHQWTYIDWLGL
jgi:hypothetical protein